MVGDSADAARAMGYRVRARAHAGHRRSAAVSPASAARSCRCTIPGSWSEGLSSGQGLMAVALVIFARWNPLSCFYAALLFGGAGALGPALQSVGVTSATTSSTPRPTS